MHPKRKKGSRGDRYLGVTAGVTQVPVPTAILPTAIPTSLDKIGKSALILLISYIPFRNFL